MPAEWSAHQATWISWPHNRETWPGLLEAAEEAMADFVTALAPHELVYINVLDDAHARSVARRLEGRVASDRIRLEQIPTDDAWIRDYGAIVVSDPEAPGGATAVNFEYNAWGGKYPPYDQDRAVARSMAERLGLPRIDRSIVLEGGSVDVNGEGLGLVTEQCLLNPNRNPGLDRGEIEATLGEVLGLGELVWLGDGIAGDDTDGHIDNLARFTGPLSVVAVVTSDEADPNFAALADNRRRLAEYRDRKGRALEVRELPLPDPVRHEGARLPASYANFYVANGIVLMPAFGVGTDAAAAGILAECFPGRTIAPIDCRALIVGLGALHCLTQQIPAIVRGFRPQE
ncbi:MAG: agmatine deiminase family protein [Gammaproteobacteria bacterium]|jgi:agmatine deiminase